MLNSKLFTFISLAIVANACDGNKNNTKDAFSIDTSNLKQVYELSESIDLKIKNDKNLTIDSVSYFFNDYKVGSVKQNESLHINFTDEKLGYRKVKAVIYTEGNAVETETNFTIASSIEPKLLKYKVLNTYPHDIKAYTQGFEFHNGILYEGTGNGAGSGTGTRDISSLRKTNFKTGEVTQKLTLAPKYFGEGITILDNKVYQLTWRNNEGYIYDADTFEKIKTFKYFKDIDGWGLTNDGEKLYMTDGSEKIYVLDSETLEELDYINVYTKHNKIKKLNELEWIDGKIWANVYEEDAIAIINLKGEIEAVLNLADLKNQVTQHPDIDVLNGIAYNPETKTIFVTGKNWDKTFEIVIDEE